MSDAFNPFDVPLAVEDAARSGELVVFVGAGISRLIKCPSWDGFADGVLSQLAPHGINYYEMSQIKSISDPKKRLSIAQIVAQKKHISINYKRIFDVKPEEKNVYSYLNSFNSSFVTTNYEKYLVPESRKNDREEKWRFYKLEHLLGVNLDTNGNVVHLHGCVDNSDSMVITTKDYLDHYSTDEVKEFLIYLFKYKTVLFLGYGLEETEILEYMLRHGEATTNENARIRRFILQGFFNAEKALSDLLQEYYEDSFATQLIGFSKDYKGYAQQVDIIDSWSKKLKFGGMILADEAARLAEEISG